MSKYTILKTYENDLMMIEDILGSGATNNIQLDKLCKYIFQNRFKGVFTSDEFPQHIKNGEMFIINNQSSKQNGMHWVSFYKYNNRLYGYDTFNRKVNKLSKFWNKKHIVNANKNRDESYNEKNCGQRCICFLLLFDKYKEKNNRCNII